MAAHRVVQYTHSQKVPGEGPQHWVLPSASTGADLKKNRKGQGWELRGKEVGETVSTVELSHSTHP